MNIFWRKKRIFRYADIDSNSCFFGGNNPQTMLMLFCRFEYNRRLAHTLAAQQPTHTFRPATHKRAVGRVCSHAVQSIHNINRYRYEVREICFRPSMWALAWGRLRAASQRTRSHRYKCNPLLPAKSNCYALDQLVQGGIRAKGAVTMALYSYSRSMLNAIFRWSDLNARVKYICGAPWALF